MRKPIEPGQSKADIDTPALVLDLDALERNIERMRALVASKQVALRPHAKASKCLEVVRMQLASGARGICCAKLGEAEALAAGGVDDLLITTPIAGNRKIRRLIDLAQQARVSTVADSAEAIRAISDAASAAGTTIAMVVEVNVGQDRCGVQPGPEAARLAGLIARLPGVRFAGLQGYHGRLQGTVSYEARCREVRDALDRLLVSAEAVRAAGHELATVTGGGTGSAPIDLELGGLTELQPGSYVFMDASYGRIEWDAHGRRVPFEQSIAILASVVSRPTAHRAIVDVGWKSASSDSGVPLVRGLQDVTFEFAGDEHGALRGVDSTSLKPGDRIELIPSHCDTTVNLYDWIVACRGDQVVDAWRLVGRGRSQ